MKKITTSILFLLIVSMSYSQVEGTWKLAEIGGALAVGPSQGDGSWWSSSLTDITTRDCLFDDSVTLAANGSYIHYMDGSTWVEAWQGGTDSCAAPVAPHDGSAASTWTYDISTNVLIIWGQGSHIGLPKAVNGGELSAASPPPVPDSVEYIMSFSSDGDTMTADLNIGGAWWRFVYQKTNLSSNPTQTVNVTFEVGTDLIAGNVSSDGLFAGGGMLGSNNAVPLSDSDGDGIWTGVAVVPTNTGGNYTFLNGNCSDWSCKEDISGQSCADASNWNDRILPVISQDTVIVACFGNCDNSNCPSVMAIYELNNVNVSIFPNPANKILYIESNKIIEEIILFDLIGNEVFKQTISKNTIELNVEDLRSGVYFVRAFSNGTSTIVKWVKN